MTKRSRRGAPAASGRPARAPRVRVRRHAQPAPGLERVLVLSGPNLDRLGRREPEIYGTSSLVELHERVTRAGHELSVDVVCRQSNHEGFLIDWINAAADEGFAGLLLNPGALTHTSYALYDALRGAGVPAVEVHLSNPDAREEFRRRSRVAPACIARVAGFGPESYVLALRGLVDWLRTRRS